MSEVDNSHATLPEDLFNFVRPHALADHLPIAAGERREITLDLPLEISRVSLRFVVRLQIFQLRRMTESSPNLASSVVLPLLRASGSSTVDNSCSEVRAAPRPRLSGYGRISSRIARVRLLAVSERGKIKVRFWRSALTGCNPAASDIGGISASSLWPLPPGQNSGR